ncbi:MAG: cytochrome C [SAR86 cluster bacterium BACL1 MAG-120813-bin36]|nr:MAG: cytochrome C [SAR86 cluster bacterium BACL1 MAG-120813-bin36]
MKKIAPLFVIALALVLFFNGKKYDEMMEARLSSPVAVCLEGESCGQATAITLVAGGASRSADEIYSTGCAACHNSGVAGSPVLGNQGQWENRQTKGYEMLVDNAWNGINGMPAKGLCADCTKEEIGMAVQYMLDAI